MYRLYEAITHAGPAIKAIINEEFGDGIMSAINFFCSGKEWRACELQCCHCGGSAIQQCCRTCVRSQASLLLPLSAAPVDKAVGADGQPRVVLSFNGKFLPYVEQRLDDIAAQTRPEQ